MSLPAIVSRQEWLAARKELLEEEKELTRRHDALSARRRGLPMVEIDKPYSFEVSSGRASLIDLFEGRHQLVVYHLMWLYDRDLACPSCSAFVDQVGYLSHLNARDTTFAAVSRAPIAKLEAFRRRMGWTFPWYSSEGSEFNYDFHVTFDESVAPIEYNYRSRAELEAMDLPIGEWDQPFDLHGLSVFLRDGARVFHTYSTYARGVDNLGFISNFLDLTALGRHNEAGVRYHDEY